MVILRNAANGAIFEIVVKNDNKSIGAPSKISIAHAWKGAIENLKKK